MAGDQYSDPMGVNQRPVAGHGQRLRGDGEGQSLGFMRYSCLSVALSTPDHQSMAR